MADMIRSVIDVAAKPAEVYAFVEDPQSGQLFAPAHEVLEVQHNGDGRVKSFATKAGTGRFTVQDFPRRYEVEYHWPGYRARYEVRLEPVSEVATRVTIDVALQPQSFRGRVLAAKMRFDLKGGVNRRLAALQQQFQKQ
jgi:hypothetical protein